MVMARHPHHPIQNRLVDRRMTGEEQRVVVVVVAGGGGDSWRIEIAS